MITRHLLIVPLLSVLALGGCRMRGEGAAPTGTEDEDTSANSSMQAQINALSNENASLKTSLAAALANKDSGPTLGATGIAGGDVEGFTRTAEGGLALPDDFAFAKGSAELNEEGKKAVGRLAERLNQGDNAGKKILIKGFTDDSPVSRASTKEKYTDNWGLSAARAASVVRALEKAGVSSERLTGSFRGQLDPRSSGAEDKGKNRRVEIYLNG